MSLQGEACSGPATTSVTYLADLKALTHRIHLHCYSQYIRLCYLNSSTCLVNIPRHSNYLAAEFVVLRLTVLVKDARRNRDKRHVGIDSAPEIGAQPTSARVVEYLATPRRVVKHEDGAVACARRTSCSDDGERQSGEGEGELH